MDGNNRNGEANADKAGFATSTSINRVMIRESHKHPRCGLLDLVFSKSNPFDWFVVGCETCAKAFA
jgi:hypothetical protein